MKFKYFPGCTLKTKGKDLDRYARKSAQALGFELEELADWQCCGAVYPMAKDEIATKLSSVRALVATRDENAELVTLCSACHNVIKQVNNDMKTDAGIALRVNNYLGLDLPYEGETNVLHFLEVLRDRVDLAKLALRHDIRVEAEVHRREVDVGAARVHVLELALGGFADRPRL